jgi:hypothetical protein
MPDTTTAALFDSVRVTTAPSSVDHPRHEHGLDTVVGYVVRQTIEGGVILPCPATPRRAGRDLVVVRGAGNYLNAVTAFNAVRRIPGSYAVADVLYACGCRAD